VLALLRRLVLALLRRLVLALPRRLVLALPRRLVLALPRRLVLALLRRSCLCARLLVQENKPTVEVDVLLLADALLDEERTDVLPLVTLSQPR
jgi:hypothetical protein